MALEFYPPVHACAYESPTTVAEAVDVLSRYGSDARVLAGGTDLVIAMRDKGVRPVCLVDIKRIESLRQFGWEADGSLVVGAAVPMTTLLQSARFVRECGMLAQAMDTVGSYQLRTRATLGGNICNSSPAADTAPPMICMGASVEIASAAGLRTVALEEFFTGPGRNVLSPGELVTCLRFPVWALGAPGVYLKQGRRQAMELAIVGVAGLRPGAGGGPVRLAVASVAPRPLRLVRAEDALATLGIEAAVAAALGEVAPISDARASAQYRRHLVRLLLRRTVAALYAEEARS